MPKLAPALHTIPLLPPSLEPQQTIANTGYYVVLAPAVGLGQSRRFVSDKVASTLRTTEAKSVSTPPVHRVLALLLAVISVGEVKWGT